MNIIGYIKRFAIEVLSSTIKVFFPVKNGRVFCESFGGLSYSCNPKYISEEILRTYSNFFQLVWAFEDPNAITETDSRIIKVKKRTIKELYYIITSEFIITNIRICNHWSGWKKRSSQKYIMTWHGSMALKRVEFDAADKLPVSYIQKAVLDSLNVDLMLSDSKWCTSFMRSAFKYDGEILEKGLPRNDIFLQEQSLNNCRNKVRRHYNIQNKEKVLLYAPTFRVDKGISNYIFEWDKILISLQKRWNAPFKVMLRLHPSMKDSVDTSSLLTSSNMIDVTDYNDMQELLCAVDVLITDYSSSMFEFAIKETPCFLYTPDADTYDRGFYFHLNELPFPVSNNLDSLVNQICDFDEETYSQGLRDLFINKFNYTQSNCSSLQVVEWMNQHSMHCA